MAGRRAVPVDSDPFGDDVVYAWSMTTSDQRNFIFNEWNNGNDIPLNSLEISHLKKDALLLASALEFGHLAVCQRNGRPRDIHYGRLRDMLMKFKPEERSNPAPYQHVLAW